MVIGSFKVDVACADTHTGSPKATKCSSRLSSYTLSGCEEKIRCESPESTEGYVVTETETTAQLFNVPATCARGYEGKAVAAACSKTGDKYTLSGCKYSTTTCAAPAATEGYVVTEVELRQIIFDVQVTCAPGFAGVAKVAKCKSDMGEYTLSGCTASPVCLAPEELAGYSVTESSLDMSSFKVDVACADTHTGSPKATKCSSPLSSYTLSGCEEKIRCESPESTEGYVVTETETTAQLFNVPTTCARGYEGKAVATACSKTGDKYTLSGCKYSSATCAAPAVTEGYVVTEVELRQIIFDVQVTCAPGYSGVAKVAKCKSDMGEYTLSGCTASPVCLAPEELAGYSVTESSLDMSSFKVDVACADTHTGSPKATKCSSPLSSYTLSGCEEKIRCESPESTEGYVVTETETTAQLFNVPTTCARGYEGKAVATACSKTGDKYTLSGCKYSSATCAAPAVTEGYVVTEVELRQIIFDVQVTCAPGYSGVAKVAKCKSDMGEYTLSGCTASPVCLAPEELAGYSVTESSLDMSLFKVDVACADTHTGSPKATKCSSPLSSYTLSGCEEKIRCESPESTEGYVVTETETTAQLFNVPATCARGYEGKAVAAACSKTGDKYTLSGCKYSTTTCAAPAATEGYVVTEVELRQIIFDVQVTCAPGFAGVAKVAKCKSDMGEYTLSGCTASPVCLAPEELAGYSVTESSLDMSSFKVDVACADTHTGSPKATKCSSPLSSYTLSGCEEKIRCESPESTEGYVVTETETTAQLFNVPATCARGYEGKAVATACSKTGNKYTLSGCKYSSATCAAPAVTEGYVVTEVELRQIIFDVQVTCAPGYSGVAKVAKCKSDMGEYTLSGCTASPVCLAPEEFAGYSVTESSLDMSSFKVDVACADTHTGSPKATKCSSPLSSYTLSGCEEKIRCESPESTEGYVVTETETTAQLFNVPTTCARGYEGKAVATACSKTGDKYTLSGCKYSSATCAAPAVTEGYVVTEVELRQIIFDVQVTCAPGYSGVAKVAKCKSDMGEYTLSGCTASPVCLAPEELAGYSVTESSLDMSSFKVDVACADTHTGSPKATKCSSPLSSYTLSGCEEKIRCESPESTEGYVVTETETTAQLFNVPTTCARGYEGKAVATACSKTGDKYTLSGCKYSSATCAAPAVTEGYVVTEVELRQIIFDVQVTCAPGYSGVAKVAKCKSDMGEYTLSGCTASPVCLAPEELAGYSVTESSLDRNSFDVQAECIWSCLVVCFFLEAGG